MEMLPREIGVCIPIENLLPLLRQALKGMGYGQVHLTVHNGQVVKVERLERIRLTGTSGSLTSHSDPPRSQE